LVGVTVNIGIDPSEQQGHRHQAAPRFRPQAIARVQESRGQDEQDKSKTTEKDVGMAALD